MTTSDAAVTQNAPAKINLTLHVTGQREDGYHLLDSLVMFTDVGDVITVTPADDLTLTIDGPFAKGLEADNNNLVLRAARLFETNKGAALTLTKNLPVASGIGGGSADAAATLLALSDRWKMPLPDWDTITALGADVGVCMSTELTRMGGIGDYLELICPTPPVHMLLVNPLVAVSTPQVFKALDTKTNPPMSDPMPDPYDTQNWLAWLKAQRNDLEAPAKELAPKITMALAALAHFEGCVLSRMSGSGATCFAIFEDVESRAKARAKLQQVHPTWWIVETGTVT